MEDGVGKFEAVFDGERDLDLEDEEDLLEAAEVDLEDFLRLGGGGDADDLRAGPLANSASAALKCAFPVPFPAEAASEDNFRFLFLSSGSFLMFFMIPVDDEARFINLF